MCGYSKNPKGATCSADKGGGVQGGGGGSSEPPAIILEALLQSLRLPNVIRAPGKNMDRNQKENLC